jgi:uncharacterized protein YqfB (UPF0267 family)
MRQRITCKKKTLIIEDATSSHHGAEGIAIVKVEQQSYIET